MAIMVVSATLTSFFSLLLGYLIYRRTVNAEVKQAFLFMAVYLSAWAFVAIFAYTTRDVWHFAQLFRFGSVFQMLHFSAFLHLAMALTGRVPRKRRYLVLLYLPCALTGLFFLLQEDYALGFELVGGAWQLNHLYKTPAFVGMTIIWFGYYGLAAYLYFARARTAAVVRERKLYRILGFSVVALVAAAVVEVLVGPLLFQIPSRGHVIAFKFLWLLCLAVVIDRFDLLTAPAALEEVALEAFPGSVVVVLDGEFRVRRFNDEAREVFAFPDDLSEPFEFCSLLPENDELHREIAALPGGGKESLACIVNTSRNGTASTLLDLKVSLLRDKDGGHLGFLLVGNASVGTLDTRVVARLSPREVEIVQEILQGHRNAGIARRLCISERTVKTHITHIFTKLGVESRLELFTLLKENNAASRHRADRKLLLVNQRPEREPSP